LLFDTMPDRAEPALAQLKAHPPKGDQWNWELKWRLPRNLIQLSCTGMGKQRLILSAGKRRSSQSDRIEQLRWMRYRAPNFDDR